MATNSETEEKVSLLRDMNGNPLREHDLVMVLLEKPVLVGFISEIKEPSILTNRDKNPVGVITVTGTIKLQFKPNEVQFMRQTAKLVDPRSDALVNSLMNDVRKKMSEAKKEEPASVETQTKAGPVVVQSSTAAPIIEES